ncbi:MAG TPA: hypothetical protein VHI78_07235 [Bacteroidales bacterium]|jgi:ferredoxin-NADP reductase|nr:hypothetical protein [Bacteroidales bacterium]
MENIKVLSIEFITRDVVQILAEKPENFDFVPGQAADISLNKEGWQNEKRPFTFTSLPDDKFLQFTIKTYPERNGVTNVLRTFRKNDEMIIHEVFGAIAYQGEGTFIAGGAGITPFISIFRSLKAKNALGSNRLLFANKTRDDIVMKYEFEHILGKNFINILSDEKTGEYDHGFINDDFLRTNITDIMKPIYLCGPPPMMEAVEGMLMRMNINERSIVKEAV